MTFAKDTDFRLPIQAMKSRLVAALHNVLGTYVRNDGTQVPSIWIGPKEPNPTWKRQGIEVIIDEPEEALQYMLGGNANIEKTWVIRLVQWDRASDLKLGKRRLMLEFPGSDFIHVAPTSSGILEQLTMRYPETEYLYKAYQNKL